MMQIFTHTPIWVWALLAFLVQRGYVMSQDRQLSVRKACLLPVLMLGWSVYGVVQLGDLNLVMAYAMVAVASAALRLKLAGNAAQSYDPATQLLTVKGSWLPMLVILGLFLGKYAYNVATAMAPVLQQSTQFVWIAQLLFALASGFFLANLLQTITAITRVKQTPAMQSI